jgi:long-chain fatty acid transport protein
VKKKTIWRYGLSLLAASAVLIPGCASATDGDFSAGYGVNNLALGGTSYALTDGGFYGANNPANGTFGDNEFSVGMNLFFPARTAIQAGNGVGPNGSATSRSTIFPIPEFSYNQHLNDRFTVGLSVYGNGGMNTAYAGGQYPAGTCGPTPGNLLCGQGNLGGNLTQVIVSPTLSYKVNDAISVGIAPQLMLQQFSASGLQAFAGHSSAPGDLTNRGDSYSYGAGVRIGGYWRINTLLAVGATYQTQVYATKFNLYRGMLAGGGSMNVPSNFGVGLALHLTPDLVLASDFERIFYSDIPSLSNASSAPGLYGASNGAGFGWKNINIYRVGVEDRVLPDLTLRAGYNHSDNPVTSKNVTFNILAPAVIQNQIAFGGSYDLSPASVISLVYTHAFKNSVTGPSMFGGTNTISLSEDEVGISYEGKF